jgi:hypothetical protein
MWRTKKKTGELKKGRMRTTEKVDLCRVGCQQKKTKEQRKAEGGGEPRMERERERERESIVTIAPNGANGEKGAGEIKMIEEQGDRKEG